MAPSAAALTRAKPSDLLDHSAPANEIARVAHIDVDRPISTYIHARLRPWNHPIRSSLSLQIGHFGAIAQLAERLDRTQEVGGSNPPSSTLAKSLYIGLFRWL